MAHLFRRYLLLALGFAIVMLTATAVCAAPASPTATPRAALHVIPSSDGTGITVAAGRVGDLTTPIHSTLQIGGTSYEPGHTSYEPGHTGSDPEDGHWTFTFEGVTARFTSPAMTVVVTTTGTTGSLTMGSSAFERRYVPGDTVANITSLDNNVWLRIPKDTLSTESYVVINDTSAPPGESPPGHRFISQAYSLRPSGGQEQTAQDMSLCISYVPALLGQDPPQTLSIFRWDSEADRWLDVESEPLGEQAMHCQSIRQFGTYALMTGTTWRDSFQDFSGLAEMQNVDIGYGGRLILLDESAPGTAISHPIAPADSLGAWGRIAYTSEIINGTTIRISVLDGRTGETLLQDVLSGADLSVINPLAHPTIQLRADLRAEQPGQTPYLDAWGVSWAPPTDPTRRLYLPLVTRTYSQDPNQSAIGLPHRTTEDTDSATPGKRSALSAQSDAGRSPLAADAYGCDPPPQPPITWSSLVALTTGNAIHIAPEVTVDHENRAHAVWYRGNGPVFYSSKEPGAAAWSAPVNISGSAGYYPHIAVDAQATVHVIWQEDSDIRYATKPRGGGWSAPINVSRTSKAGLTAALRVDGTGNVHIAWVDSSPGNNEIYYASKASGASAWSAPERVSDTTGTSWAPALAVNSQGVIHVIWYDFTPGATEIYYAFKAPGMAAWSAALNVSNTAGGSQWPALVIDAQDALHLVWQDTLPLAGQGQALILYYAAKSFAGGWSQPLELARSQASSEKAQPPELAISPYGALHVAWADMTDYRLRYAIKPDAETGWSIPQVVATLIPPPNPANQWYFIGLAADPDRGVHLIWNDMAGTGTFNQDVKYAAALPPPIPADHVLVLDEAGRAVSGACVYRNGRLAGATDDLGIFALDGLTIGERLVAVKPLAEQPAGRRSGWAYRTSLTSLELSGDGEVLGHDVSAAGRQRLTVSSGWPLIYFNLVVSVQWNATPEYLAEIASAMRQASDYLYDVSDGQMAFGQVAIYDDAAHWEDADIQILARNNVRPYAYIGGIASPDPAMTIRVGRYWNGSSGDRGGWDERNGFRTLIHEFGHYGLYLFDSYFEYQPSYPGGINTVTGCTKVAKAGYLSANDAINASLMDYQYRTSELAARGVPGMWADSCMHTVQWQENGESDWETLLRRYADSADPPRWQLTSPLARSRVLPGPTGLPAELLAFPQVAVHDAGVAAPPRQVSVLGPDGRPYALGALVALDTQRAGSLTTIDQGLTAISPVSEAGQIAVFGATAGNKLRAISIDGSLWDEQWVGPAAAYTLTLHSASGRLAAALPLNPYASLISDSEGRELLLSIHGVGAGGALSALLAPPGGGAGQTIALSYSPVNKTYTGVAGFPALTTGLGSVHVRGLGGVGQVVSLDNDFHLAPVAGVEGQDFYSPDGAAWLHLDAGSFAQSNVSLILMPTGAVPQPLPAGTKALGNAYSIRASGGITETVAEHHAVLRLFYKPDDLNMTLPTDLRIARWDGLAWQILGGQPDPERFTVAAQTGRLGIYVLLAPEESEGHRVYLPVVWKK